MRYAFCRLAMVAVFAAVVALPSAADSEKPLGGICECGAYVEGPSQCAPLSGTQREACISSNLRWLDRCTAWRTQICRAPAVAAKPVLPAAPVLAAPAQPTPAPQAAPPSSPELTKFGGAWKGEVQCRLDRWRLKLNVAQLADGSLLKLASSSQAFGSFEKIDLKGDDITLYYNTWLNTVVYTGRLVTPNRIEGTVPVAGSTCQWYLAR